MKVLLVLAHPEPESFNGALFATARATLEVHGHEVMLSDLYAMEWKAVADGKDFPRERAAGQRFALDSEQLYAHQTGTTSVDIVAEQQKIQRADLIVFHYPMWWFMPPAILKGWFDRVFTKGFAYVSGRKYDSGLLSGKVAMVTITTGTSAGTYAPDGVDGALLDILWPMHNGVLRYTGFDVLEPFVVHAPGAMSPEERHVALGRYAEVLGTIGTRPRLFFHPAKDYGDDERLLPDVEPRSGFQHRSDGT